MKEKTAALAYQIARFAATVYPSSETHPDLKTPLVYIIPDFNPSSGETSSGTTDLGESSYERLIITDMYTFVIHNMAYDNGSSYPAGFLQADVYGSNNCYQIHHR